MLTSNYLNLQPISPIFQQLTYDHTETDKNHNEKEKVIDNIFPATNNLNNNHAS